MCKSLCFFYYVKEIITLKRREIFLFLFAWAWMLGGGAGKVAAINAYYVDGAGGVPLAVKETGLEGGPKILFLHGIGQGADSFEPQFNSALARHFHMVAFDLRGHGLSGKPWREEDYAAPRVWAEDVHLVMAATGLERPVLVAWSFGSFVAADFIRVYGTDKLSGLVLVDGPGGFVKIKPVTRTARPELEEAARLRAIPSFADLRKVGELVAPFLVAGNAAPGWLDQAAMLSAQVPPFVQPLLRKRSLDNTDLQGKLNLPVLWSYGALDASTPLEMENAFKATISDLTVRRYETAGHSPFAEVPVAFNSDLANFVRAVTEK